MAWKRRLDWARNRPDYLSRASVASICDLAGQIVERLGFNGAKAVLGVPALTLAMWIRRERKPSAAARRAIFLTWFLLRYPHPKLNMLALATEGRFGLDCGPEPTTGSVQPSSNQGEQHTSP